MATDSAWALGDGWAGLEGLLGGFDALDALAVTTGAIKRRRSVRDGAQLFRLALYYGTTAGGLRTTAAWGALSSERSLSGVALLKRLREADGFVEAALGLLLARLTETVPDSGWDGPPIRIVDGSLFTGPGPSGARLRLHATYDPAAGSFVGLELTGLDQGESLGRAVIEPGSVAVADRNYARTHALRQVAENNAFFLVRAGANAMRIQDPQSGRPLRSEDYIAALGAVEAVSFEAEVIETKAKIKSPPLPVRLIVMRASEAQTARENARIKRSRTKHGATPQENTLRMTDIVVLITNLDPQRWTIPRIKQLYRLRWQIELAFKTLKSDFDMRRCPAKDPRLAKTWVLANLAAALLANALADACLGVAPP